MPQQENITNELDLKRSAHVKGLKTSVKTANYTVTMEDSFSLLIANHATNQITFTLPEVAAAAGGIWFFSSLGAAGMKIVGGTADKMVVVNDAAADSVSYETSGKKIGSACMVIGNGANYYFFEMSGATTTVA